MIVKCEHCEKEFNKPPSQIKRTRHNFCTQSCASKYNNSLHPKRKKQGKCKKCSIPITMRRVYCGECAKNIPWITNRGQKKKTERDCRICGKTYMAVSRYQCRSCLANNRRHKVKQDSLDYKGGRCEICGYDKCSRALTFHHIDESAKSFSISGNHCRAWSVIQKELDKCSLLCHNCHTEVHAGLHAERNLLIER